MFRSIITIALFVAATSVLARDLDGRYAQSPLRDWFNSLTNKNGNNCCSNADGMRLEDPNWRRTDKGFEVNLGGAWIEVPDDRVVSATNRVGYAIVWPFQDENGTPVQIRCFMPGSDI